MLDISYGGRMKYRQVENRQFSSPPVFNAPADVVPLELGIGARSQKKLEWLGRWLQKSGIGLAV